MRRIPPYRLDVESHRCYSLINRGTQVKSIQFIESDAVLQQLLAPALPTSNRANQWLEIGDQKYKAGDFEASLEYWTEALDIYRKLRDSQGEAKTLSNIETVLQALKRNLDLYKQTDDQEGEIKALTRLANAYFILRDFKEAENVIRQSIEEIKNSQDKVREELLVKTLSIYLGNNWIFSAGVGLAANDKLLGI